MKRSILKITSRATLGLLLCAGLLFPAAQAQAAQTTQVSGSANVVLREVSTQSSTGASAQASIGEENQATLQADLTLPGSWAAFTIVAENCGEKEANLSNVLQQQDMPENVNVSFGISDRDAGEKLQPGEQCAVSVVVEADPEETESFDETGSFSLTLIYDADEGTTGTGTGHGFRQHNRVANPMKHLRRREIIFRFPQYVPLLPPRQAVSMCGIVKNKHRRRFDGSSCSET